MSEDTQSSVCTEPALTPQQRRLEAIRRCTEGALSGGQKYLEDQYLNPDLRRLLWQYMDGFKRYLPEICDYESACDFIACVTYGLSIDAITMERGSKLLYAAQVAINALRPAKEAKRAS